MLKHKTLKPKAKQWAWFFGLYFIALIGVGSFSMIVHYLLGK